MLKTVEALFTVVLVFTTIAAVQTYIQLPSPRLASSVGQQELVNTMLKSLDNDGSLTNAAFAKGSKWSPELLKSIDSSLPSNTIYKLTAYKIEFNATSGSLKYIANKTAPENPETFPSGGITSTYTITSPDVTVTQTPEKIRGKDGPLTLYILNCADANGWWITGFTGQTLANDVYEAMSPYFETTILVNSITQLETLLSGSPITSNPTEQVQSAVFINTFGESIPIPSSQASTYQQYPYQVGKRVNMSNWTWVSIVGYPFYYASNKDSFASDENSWGIYGMKVISSKGLNYFLQGIDYPTHTTPVENNTWITSEIPGVVYCTNLVREAQAYYGLYPGITQTSTRALPLRDLGRYHMTLPLDGLGRDFSNIFLPVTIGITKYYAGATWVHKIGSKTSGAFMAIGLARTPDIRVALIGLLAYYRPTLLRSEFSASGTTRVVELQVGQLGAS
jgi:hypothetical protein